MTQRSTNRQIDKQVLTPPGSGARSDGMDTHAVLTWMSIRKSTPEVADQARKPAACGSPAFQWKPFSGCPWLRAGGADRQGGELCTENVVS